MKAIFVIAPECHPKLCTTARDNRPHGAIMRRHRAVCCRWMRVACGVRMVIADDRRPTGAGFAMGVDQGLRINLEMRLRTRVDIGGWLDRRDCVVRAQQEPAAFIGVGGG